MITEEMCLNLLKELEGNCKDAKIKRDELQKLKKQITKEEDTSNLFVMPKKEEIIEDIEEFDDEMSFYLDSYKLLGDEFNLEDILDILPNKDNYNYKDIVYRLIAESYKEIKEITEICLEEELSKEELKEYRELIDNEKLKISYLNEALDYEEEAINVEHKNKLVLVPTVGGSIRVIEEIKNMAPEYHEQFLSLINSIVDGTFKNVKVLTGNKELTGIPEVKGHQTRVVFARIDKNTYALITAFIKKTTSNRIYVDSLVKKVVHYKKNSSLLKEKLNDPEFMELNDLYVEELFNILTPKDNSKGVK